MSHWSASDWCDRSAQRGYRSALAGYGLPALRGICQRLTLPGRSRSPQRLADAIEGYLAEPGHWRVALEAIPDNWQTVLSVLSFTPPGGWSYEALCRLLRFVGCTSADSALRVLLYHGLVVAWHPDSVIRGSEELELILSGWGSKRSRLLTHPAVSAQGSPPALLPRETATDQATEVRESDGRDLLIRLAALGQRLAESPLRITHQGAPYKRDWDRLRADPVIDSAPFDELAPVSDPLGLLLELAGALNLLAYDEERRRLRMSLSQLGQGSLPELCRQMTYGVLGSERWSEWGSGARYGVSSGRRVARRWGTLLLLACLPGQQWLPLKRLTEQVAGCEAGGGRFPPARLPDWQQEAAGSQYPPRQDSHPLHEWVQTFLLGTMFQLGVVQVAREPAGGQPLVRLSPLGRWCLRLESRSPPPSVPADAKVLFVQPNHEIVAYRQGLSPELVGQLASFCRYKTLGAAVTLEVSSESVFLGLDLGRTADEMIAILERHSAQPVPAAVQDSIRTWAQRRERIAFYSGCVMLEFPSAQELQQAIAAGVTGQQVGDRLLLVVDDRLIPFEQLRLTGSCDYRRRLARCVTVSADGTLLEVDARLSDLLVYCELPRFAEAAPETGPSGWANQRYRLTPQSLVRAVRSGLDRRFLLDWFRLRAGCPVPPSVELMLQASSRTPLHLSRPYVVQVSSRQVADGLLQHPLTQPLGLQRLGPTTVSVSPQMLSKFRAAMRRLGITLADHADT